MAERLEATANGGWGRSESLVLGAALVGFAASWALYVTSPPDGLVSPFGMVISLLAGAYLLVVVYSYLA